jgi:hypothetical protein
MNPMNPMKPAARILAALTLALAELGCGVILMLVVAVNWIGRDNACG